MWVEWEEDGKPVRQHCRDMQEAARLALDLMCKPMFPHQITVDGIKCSYREDGWIGRALGII